MRRDALYLADIVDAAEAIERFLVGISEEEFLADELRQSAVLQKLTVIGEAVARLSSELKAGAQDIPWNLIAGFRNIAVHAYFNVDWQIVWTTATQDVPALKPRIEALISHQPNGE